MFRKPVNKSKSARKFKRDVGRTKMANFSVTRGGFRM